MGLTSKLAGVEFKRLQEALVAAFPTRNALAQMVRVALGMNLEAIAAQENLSATVFELIRWAEAQGRLDALVCGALAANTGNPELRAFAKEHGRQGQHPVDDVGTPNATVLTAVSNRAAHPEAPTKGAGNAALNGSCSDKVDVLIVTAVKDEWNAVLAVDTGARPGTVWLPRPGAVGPEVCYRTYTAHGGGELRVAVVQAFGMGREQAVIAAAPLLERHAEIRCLAMCGVCAGRRGEVALGDVIIADRTWPYDAGKVKATVDEGGHRTERFQSDMDLYRIQPPEWKLLAERFQPDPEAPWLNERPPSYEEQGAWVLERLAKNDDPVAHPERMAKCPDWAKVLEQLWKVQWLDDGSVKLAEAGRAHIRRRMMLEPDGLRGPGPVKVVVGPIASGAPVVQDPTIFDRLETAGMRKVVGLEMETSAILALAYLRKVPHAIVMKGVMDHADAFKSDNMKAFAATASAECLIAFLRRNLPARAVTEPQEPARPYMPRGSSDGIVRGVGIGAAVGLSALIVGSLAQGRSSDPARDAALVPDQTVLRGQSAPVSPEPSTPPQSRSSEPQPSASAVEPQPSASSAPPKRLQKKSPKSGSGGSSLGYDD